MSYAQQPLELPDAFLTPEQRQTIVADILSDIALRLLHQRSAEHASKEQTL